MIGAEPGGDLTPAQHTILLAIRQLTERYGHPPSMREVLNAAGLASAGGLSYQYKRLTAKGYLRRTPGQPRTVEVRLPGEDCYPSEAASRPAVSSPAADDEPPDPRDVARLPVVGEIWASPPGLAVESISGYLPLPTGIVGREDGTFILTVRGDSMIGAGILPGDYVVVRPLYRPPRNGDIVVAILDGIEPEATVKTYLKAGRQVWLIPQNPAHLPIPGNRATFAGQVVAVLRQL